MVGWGLVGVGWGGVVVVVGGVCVCGVVGWNGEGVGGDGLVVETMMDSLHLTRREDLLDLETPEPDLSLYDLH